MMKTFVTKPAEVERNWYVVDADGETLGRLASKIAAVLRGKHKPTFSPSVDCGDFVVVINADKINVTGRRLDQTLVQQGNVEGEQGGFLAAVLRGRAGENAADLAHQGTL